jgi:uncharacterized protein
MAEIPIIVRENIDKFLNELELNNITIQKAILFGSYANGNANEWSDVDLAIVSDKFSGNRFDDKDMIRKFKAVVNWDISPLPYTPQDFYNSIFVRDEIINKGIIIK